LALVKTSAERPKPTLRKRVVRTSFLCMALYLLACVGCASLQRRMIYYPPVLSAEAVEEAAKSEGLERWNDAAGKPIGWKRLSPAQPAQGQVLILHGNAGCAFQCGHYADVIQQAAPLDVFIVEFPGYADRPGKPTERSLEDSAVEGLQSLPANVPTYLVGESLGTGVATYLAGRFPDRVAGVALLAPYNRLADVAQAHMPIFPVKLLLVDRFPSEDHLRNYHGPVASLVAGKDQVVPEKFGRRLHDGYAGPKQLWEFPDGDHGTVMLQPPEIWKEIVGFWKTHAASEKQETAKVSTRQ
jgi:pimeloyl-ACP methyl ester carboxylesterase